MRRFILSLPVFFLCFFAGALAVSVLIPPPVTPKAPAAPEKFEVVLTRIEVRNSDKRRWDSNDGYISINDAEFLDENTILALYLEDGMRMSRDGGKTWQPMFAENGGNPKGTGAYSLSKLDFLDGSTGWASGGSLISTRDGGQTWQLIKLPEWMDNLRIKFLDENFGYVAGRAGFCNRDRDRCNTSLTLYKTTDGGRSWKKSLRTRENTTPWDIVIVDENIAMMTSEGGWLYRTDNGGKSWKTVLAKDYHHVMSISRAPDGRYWLFGTNSIRVSDDLGLTWKKAENIDEGLVNHEWNSVDFTEDGLGVAVSEDASIALTRDGGRSWKQAISNIPYKGKPPVPGSPHYGPMYYDALWSIRLYKNKGIITGDRRDYLISIQDPIDFGF